MEQASLLVRAQGGFTYERECAVHMPECKWAQMWLCQGCFFVYGQLLVSELEQQPVGIENRSTVMGLCTHLFFSLLACWALLLSGAHYQQSVRDFSNSSACIHSKPFSRNMQRIPVPKVQETYCKMRCPKQTLENWKHWGGSGFLRS